MKQMLQEELNKAIKAHNKVKTMVIRQVMSKITTLEKEKGTIATDAQVLDLIKKERKEIKQTIEEAEKANRQDIIEATMLQLNEIILFIPEELSENDLRIIIVEEIKAHELNNMGAAMKHLVPMLGSKCDKRLISKIVKEVL